MTSNEDQGEGDTILVKHLKEMEKSRGRGLDELGRPGWVPAMPQLAVGMGVAGAIVSLFATFLLFMAVYTASSAFTGDEGGGVVGAVMVRLQLMYAGGLGAGGGVFLMLGIGGLASARLLSPLERLICAPKAG